MKTFLLISFLTMGCVSADIKQSNETLIDCINNYKKTSPTMSSNLAYTYCNIKLDIVNKKQSCQ